MRYKIIRISLSASPSRHSPSIPYLMYLTATVAVVLGCLSSVQAAGTKLESKYVLLCSDSAIACMCATINFACDPRICRGFMCVIVANGYIGGLQ